MNLPSDNRCYDARIRACCRGVAAFSTISNSPISSMRLSCAHHMAMPTSPASTRARRFGRPCRTHWRGLSRRWPRLAAFDGALQEARWRPDVSAAAAGDCVRPRHACRLPSRGDCRRAVNQARDAAECVVVDYEPRPGVVSARDAFAPNAPQLYDECPSNEAYFYQAGDKAKVDAAFAACSARRRTAPDH